MAQSQIEPQLEKRVFAPGREIFMQGEVGDAAYLIESGTVTIYQHLEGKRVELATVRHGEIFGEMAAIDGGLRMASAVASTQVVCTRIPKEMFDRKLGATDKFVKGILNFFIRNIRGNHQVFVRRPRSVRDHLRLMESLVHEVRDFAQRVEDPVAADGLQTALAEMDRALIRLTHAAERCRDSRHDLVVEEHDRLAVQRMAERRRATAASA